MCGKIWDRCGLGAVLRWGWGRLDEVTANFPRPLLKKKKQTNSAFFEINIY